VKIDSTSSPGSIKIAIPSVEGYNSDDSQIDLGDLWKNLVDESLITRVQFMNEVTPDGIYYLIDFKTNVSINSVKIYSVWTGSAVINAGIDYWNGSAWMNVATGDLINGVDGVGELNNLWTTFNFDAVTGSKIRLRHISGNSTGAWDGISEFEPYYNNTELYDTPTSTNALHTTTSTQIDGGANFWQWETFTDSKITPANTSVTYRFRTSSNGTDWTSWVGSIGAVTSRTGDDSNNPTKYRYLQIEATLSNTDGASTPTIDSYSIGYHTNQKPNAPTAMTAVVN
jgi:hypothetical protein